MTSTVSHSIGTSAAENIFCTAADISGPIPSPGIKVTFFTSVLYDRFVTEGTDRDYNYNIN